SLAKNENWYGYDLPENEGLYQTTNITVQAVGEASTRLQMFLRGELDSYGLTADDMADYQMSDYTYYTKGESTFAMVFNPNKSALEAEQAKDGANINKTIITLKDFRMAMALGLDRAAFCLATSPVNSAAFGLYSSLIISDPESGEAYRTTEGAKDALLNFWGLADDVGEGKLYETKDDAIDAITGYDLATAKVLFDKAYDEAIATGLMDEDDVVLITIGTPNMTSNFYNSGYDYLVKNYTEAVKGTKLEGKLTFERDGNLGGSDFAKALQTNQVDMLFGVGWTGSALDPYRLIEAYTSPNYQYDPAFDTSVAMCDVELDGKVLRASLWDWTEALAGETILATVVVDGEETEDVVEIEAGTSAAYETRLTILSAMENSILGQYDFIPMMDESTASLKGMKIKYYTEDYVYGVGRGGLKYMSYNYSDAEWTAFVAAQGGELLYK
ncbi:MAG: ABC transporter substrate-binding protein, partial [Christensenellaceae bacterium]